MHLMSQIRKYGFISLIRVYNFLPCRCLPVRKELPLQISKLDGYHAELVDACLPYGGSQESLNHARVCSCHLPNRCVTDEKGWCVSWILSNEQCELMPAYTSSDTGHLQALSPVGMRTVSFASSTKHAQQIFLRLIFDEYTNQLFKYPLG